MRKLNLGDWSGFDYFIWSTWPRWFRRIAIALFPVAGPLWVVGILGMMVAGIALLPFALLGFLVCDHRWFMSEAELKHDQELRMAPYPGQDEQ